MLFPFSPSFGSTGQKVYAPGCAYNRLNMEPVLNINPILPLIVALLVGSIAASGRFSLNAANILLFVAWAAGVFAITQSGVRDRHVKIAAEIGVGVVVLLTSLWVTQRHRRKASGSDKR